MGSDDGHDKETKILKLTKENHEKWFRNSKLKLKGKGIFYTIEVTKHAYAWIARLGAGTSTSTATTTPTPADIGYAAEQESIRDLASDFERLGGTWNAEKAKEYDKDEAKALFYITNSLHDDDDALADEYETASALWTALKAKYSKTDQLTANNMMAKLQNFSWEDEKNVDYAWAKLKEYRRKIVAAKPAAKGLYDDEALLQIMLRALPQSYGSVIDYLDLQTTLKVEEKIAALRTKELRLDDTAEHANVAFPKYRHPNHRRKSDSSIRDRSRSASPGTAPDTGCLYCKGEHWARDCEYKDEIQEWGTKLREKSERADRRAARSKRSSRDKDKKPSKKPVKSMAKATSKRKHGYAAKNQNSDSRDVTSSLDSDNEISHGPTSSDTEGTQQCHISAEQASRSTPANWVADTGASSHMTDKRNLFRGPLKRTPLTTIQVGGGFLYSTQRGTVMMKAQDGTTGLLRKVLYVPKLGVNLIAAKRLCKEGLQGSFDDKNMYFRDKSTVAVQATQKDGLYVVSHIASKYSGKAFIAGKTQTEISEQSTTEESQSETQSDQDPDESEEEKSTKKDRRNYRLMHRRFAHYGPAMLRKLHQVSSIQRIKVPPAHRRLCDPCLKGKMRNKISKTLAEHKKEILALVSLDLAGPFPTSLRGNNYLMQMICNYSRKNWSIPLKSKDQAIPELRRWKAKVELQTGKKVKACRSDNAPELKLVMNQWETEDGVQADYTVTASSNQNGPAERSIQTAEHAMRAMLDDAQLPIEFWDEAAEADAYIRNRLPTGPLVEKQSTSPEQVFLGKRPNVDHVRVWGSKCYTYLNPKTLPAKGRSDKLMHRGRAGVFMGYSETTDKQFKVYSPDLGYTHRVSVIQADEKVPGGKLDLNLRVKSGPMGTSNELVPRKARGRPRKNPDQPAIVPTRTEDKDGNLILQKRTEAPDVEASVKTTSPLPSPPTPAPTHLPPPTPTVEDEGEEMETDEVTESAVEPPARYHFRARVPKRKRDSFDDMEDEHRQSKIVKAMLAVLQENRADEDSTTEIPTSTYHHEESAHETIVKAFYAVIVSGNLGVTGRAEINGTAFAATEVKGIQIPQTYKQAMSDPENAQKWKEAIEEEIRTLVGNGTWEELLLPQGANLVTTKWVFTVKLKVDGTIERFKARLVARGFSQQHGIDYTETFAPTVRMDTLRLFLATVAKQGKECWQFDIKNAFTESYLKEDIYLKPPVGVKVKTGNVLKVLRSLYGLKQAGRDWNLLLKGFLVEIGFVQSRADPCLFTHKGRGISLLVYVDDIAAAAKLTSDLAWFDKTLRTRFNSKNLGEIGKILGVRVTRDTVNKAIYLDQQQYLETILDKYGITSAKYKPKKIPAADYEHLKPPTPDDARIDSTQYSQIIGSLMYAMVFTRPDIAFVLGRLAQYMRDPAEIHGIALKNLMRYLRSTVKQKLRFGPGGDHQNEFGVYTDADWASDKSDRKSMSGGVGMFYGGPFSWAAKKQKSVATSSAESEYISQAMYAKQGQWAAQVLRDLGLHQYVNKNGITVQMYGDNQGAIALVKNPHLHERSKHIDICYHFIRDLAEQKKLQISYIPTDEMIADGMTKPLQRVAFERFKKMLGVVDEGR